jgi:hypothetical protein
VKTQTLRLHEKAPDSETPGRRINRPSPAIRKEPKISETQQIALLQPFFLNRPSPAKERILEHKKGTNNQ